MSKTLSRRDLFKGLAAAVGGTATAAAATAGAAMAAQPWPLSDAGLERKADADVALNTFPRWDANLAYSPPPRLMGKQMGSVHTVSQPALGYEMDGNVKVFHLIAQPVRTFISHGSNGSPGGTGRFKYMPMWPKEVLAWGLNGICPGPTIEAVEGDRIRIVFKNELPEPSSIHWHGVELPFADDGAAGYYPFQAHLPIPPGGTHMYEFTLYQSGTLMYHSGFNATKQEGMGIAGMLVVHPKDPPHKIDKDFAILLQQWNFFPGNVNPNVTRMDVKFATFNGKTPPDLEMMTVSEGDRVRIRLGNLSLVAHPIHLHGYTFKIVGTAGGPIPESAQWSDVTVNVPPGTTRDIELIAWNPGTWRFHCHILHHIVNQMADTPFGIRAPEGMFTHLHVIPKDPNYNPKNPNAPWQPPNREEVG